MQDAGSLQLLDECLAKATAETFEMLCFSNTEPSTEAAIHPASATARRVDFDGDATGRLCLAMNSDTARLLAANFYGMDEASLEPFQIEALVNELTNVVCGSMLSKFSPHGTFSLSSPELSTLSCLGTSESLERSFRLESGDVFISVSRRPR